MFIDLSDIGYKIIYAVEYNIKLIEQKLQVIDKKKDVNNFKEDKINNTNLNNICVLLTNLVNIFKLDNNISNDNNKNSFCTNINNKLNTSDYKLILALLKLSIKELNKDEHLNKNNNDNNYKSKSNPSFIINTLQSYINSINYLKNDGKISILNKNSSTDVNCNNLEIIDILIKYCNIKHIKNKLNINSNINYSNINFLMLNINTEFKDIVNLSHKVMFIGGTLKPYEEINNLFSNINNSECVYYEAEHVIPKENIKTRILPFIPDYILKKHKKDLLNNKLIFKYNKLKENKLVYFESIIYFVELFFECIEKSNNFKYNNNSINASNFEKKGIVVFFQSYDCLHQFKLYLNALSNSKNDKNNNEWLNKIINNMYFEDKLDFKNNVFISYSNSLNNKLINSDINSLTNTNYNELKRNSVNILFCVIGGKLSEGINFNDNLARLVLIVGLPFANINSINIYHKMNYYDNLLRTNRNNNNNNNNNLYSGNEYYVNLCMKAVNQSIGRSVRHINDYCMVYLMDYRYTTSNISNKLPKWINIQDNNDNKNYINNIKHELYEFYKCK